MPRVGSREETSGGRCRSGSGCCGHRRCRSGGRCGCRRSHGRSRRGGLRVRATNCLSLTSSITERTSRTSRPQHLATSIPRCGRHRKATTHFGNPPRPPPRLLVAAACFQQPTLSSIPHTYHVRYRRFGRARDEWRRMAGRAASRCRVPGLLRVALL